MFYFVFDSLLVLKTTGIFYSFVLFYFSSKSKTNTFGSSDSSHLAFSMPIFSFIYFSKDWNSHIVPSKNMFSTVILFLRFSF